jgi:hypothetical protein
LVAVLALLLPLPARAHEFWIEPKTFRPEVGSVLRLGLHLGERFAGEPFPRNPALIDTFVVVGPRGEQPVMGRSGGMTNFVRIEAFGLHVIGYRSLRSRNELPAEKFESYLREEGLEAIVALRARQGESRKPGREVFSRCAKSLIAAGGEAVGGYDRALGFTLELVPQQNPYTLGEGERLAVGVLHDGRPLAGAKLVAVNRREPEKLLSAVSDADGRATFRLASAGVWMITTVHIVRAPRGVDADWESFWASLTFETPAGNVSSLTTSTVPSAASVMKTGSP